MFKRRSNHGKKARFVNHGKRYSSNSYQYTQQTKKVHKGISGWQILFVIIGAALGIYGSYNHVYSNGGELVGADGHKITLVHNSNARDVPYADVINFVIQDKVYEIPYDTNKFTCGDYAEKVQNDAENAGIKCGYVCVDFTDNSAGHACNVFNTTDRGIIYVDCTRYASTVDIVDGQEYQPVSIISMDTEYSHTTIMPMGVVKDHSITW